MKSSDERLLRLLQEARQALESERKRRTEPLAIVGIGCRFPGGAASPEQFWSLLAGGVDASGDVPRDRWDADAVFDADARAPGKSYVKRGNFLERIDEFEPEFFGISPREALGLDPQQRLLLEVTWEALEDAGIVPTNLKGSATGVWVGLSIEDYARRGVPTGQLERIDPYTALGNTRSLAAGRIAYVLGVHGPVIQLDTACSSSLVAVHQAAQSLRAGECDLAIVGGVNLMSSPEATVALCKLQALSPDGRCKTFDASADGYGRGEGCGVVVLKRLADAHASGERVHAILRGSAINHDGRSNGLTAPNGVAQEAVIRAALANAAVDPSTVAYVEAHGTGTLLGDPIEVLALSRVYGAVRSAELPLHLGSVKTNFGHLEAAAGVAALIKTVLCLSYGELVPHLHFREPNPKIPWRDLPVCVTTERRAFPEYAGTRVAAVSSFGISGTNAHVLLERAEPRPPQAATAQRSAELVALSARTEGALRHVAARLRRHLDAHPELELADVAHSLVTTRASLERRWSVAVASRQALCDALDAFVAGSNPSDPPASGLIHGKLAFVFSGQGSQWLGMGRRLLAEEPAFHAALMDCDRAILAETGWSVVEELTLDPARSRLGRIEVVQPALFAVQVALAMLWRSWGVEPDAVVGHSMGEIAAACVADALTLADGAAIVCRRSALLSRISGHGEMALVELSMSETAAALRGLEDRLSVAVSNSKRSTVVSGEPHALATLLEKLERDGVFCRRVKVDVASHSPQVDPLLEELARSLAGIAPRAPRILMHSTVTDAPVAGEALDAAYWVDNLRKPVCFARAIDGLTSQGFEFFLEVSPHPLLTSAIDETCRDGGKTVVVAGSLRRDQPERLSLLDSLGVLNAHGLELDPARFPGGGRRVELPTYPWERARYWIESAPPARVGRATAHPLLGVRLAVAGRDAVYETVLSRAQPAWLGEHRVDGRILVPGAALVELIRGAAADYGSDGALAITIVAPVAIDADGGRRAQVVLTEDGRRGAIHSQPSDADVDAAWTLHATAELSPDSRLPRPERLDVAALRARCSDPFPIETAYDRFRSAGVEYGAAFQGLKRLWRGNGEALAELELASDLRTEGYGVHPALLDAALQALVALFDGEPGRALLPVEFGRFVVHRAGESSLLAHVRLLESRPSESILADVTLADASGAVVAEVHGFYARSADVRTRAGSLGDDFYRVEWRPFDTQPAPGLAGRWALVAMSEDADVLPLTAALRRLGASAEAVALSDLARERADHVVCVWSASGDAEAAMRGAEAGLAAARALLDHARPPRLFWVTERAVEVLPGEGVAVAGSTAWGLARTLRQERPELRVKLIDVDDRASIALALRHDIVDEREPEAAWRAGRRHVARLVRAPSVAEALAAENHELVAKRPGTLDGLELVSTTRRAPSAGEVEIEVLAAGVNFRDVVAALGMLPDERSPLGGECAGVVARIGHDVRTVSVGDRVMALASRTFSRFAIADERLVAPVPAGLSIEQAAAVPVAFSTAWYALHDLAALKHGERVLVHAAAGGVGMAAVQLAQWIGAEVLGTASPSKWDSVRSLGVRHLASSRDLGFVDAFRSAHGGADVVLNSLAGDFVDAGASLLAAGGRFIEMGKTDIRDPATVAARHPGVTYRAFDLAEAGVPRLAEILRAIGAGFATGHLRALPVRTFGLAEAEGAFRFMAQARHVGKLVLLPAQGRLAASGTVLITGGLGALGFQIAEALARRGARHLLLTGRRGLSTLGAAEAVRELEALGASVTVAAVDATDREALADVLASGCADWPLRGVIHAAGVLDDGVLSEQTPERFARVMTPKVLGAWNLHTLTEGADLEFFAVLSSIAGTFGSPGQGSYAAANTFLDALVAKRRAHGLSGVSIAFGPFKDRGLAVDRPGQQQARLAREGLSAFPIAEAARLFEDALDRRESALVVAAIDWNRLESSFEDAVPPLFQDFVTRAAPGRAPSIPRAAHDLLELTSEDRAAKLLEIVRAEVARVLSISNVVGISAGKPLKELGLDSLMALELRNALSSRCGVKLPATLAFAHPTVQAIAAHLFESMTPAANEAAPIGSSLPITGAEDARFEADALLAADVRPSSTSLPALERENVLLTGATGFLGAFLLRDLLEQTRARVHCLVRAKSPADGAQRIARNLREYGLWQEAFASRLVVHNGDLGAPLLGLEAAAFERLADEVDAIYNNGAQLSFVGTYRDLEPSHVNGTTEILRLASRGRAKAVHHVSSAAVYESSAYGGRSVAESELPVESRGLHLGYAQCKWVSENLVWQAAARGLWVTVHRPAFIAGSSVNGAWNRADFLCRMVKAIILAGSMPNDLDIELDFSPVDYVSRSIVYLSGEPSARGRAFHLQNPRGLSFEAFGDILRSLGYPVRGVPYWQWVERIDADPGGPLHALLPFLAHRWPPEQLTSVELWQRSHRPKLACEHTTAQLRGSGIECPPLDAQLVYRYLAFLSSTGFITRAPRRHARTATP